MTVRGYDFLGKGEGQPQLATQAFCLDSFCVHLLSVLGGSVLFIALEKYITMEVSP